MNVVVVISGSSKWPDAAWNSNKGSIILVCLTMFMCTKVTLLVNNIFFLRWPSVHPHYILLNIIILYYYCCYYDYYNLLTINWFCYRLLLLLLLLFIDRCPFMAGWCGKSYVTCIYTRVCLVTSHRRLPVMLDLLLLTGRKSRIILLLHCKIN